MTRSGDCSDGLDPRRLVRDGTSQEQRALAALDPSFAPVDEHGPAHRIVFAKAFAVFLRYFDANDVATGDWQTFFNRDVSVQTALAAVADVTEYRLMIKSLVDRLASRQPLTSDAELIRAAGALFSAIGSLARQLDAFKETLPTDDPLRAAAANAIQTQLRPVLRRLIGYYKAGQALNVVIDVVPSPNVRIFGQPVAPFSTFVARGVSVDWFSDSGATTWTGYYNAIAQDSDPYGPPPTVPGPVPLHDIVNHLATHNLFTNILDVFLRAYARVVEDAATALEGTFARGGHQPHYALFLAFVRLLEHSRAESNTLTGRHLDFYYREVLRLRERPAAPGHAHLIVELAKQVQSHVVPAGASFRAGKDDLGFDAFFAADRELVANKAQVLERRTVYRHDNAPDDLLAHQDGRMFASPVADSDDGLGAKLQNPDHSWHPLFSKVYDNGALKEIRMPPAEVGFAIASHHLLMAEGSRGVVVTINTSGQLHLDQDKSKKPGLKAADFRCRLTTEKGWLETSPSWIELGSGQIQLFIDLTGEDPAITPFQSATHGYTFETDVPVLMVTLRHRPSAAWCYHVLEDLGVREIEVAVNVSGIRTLTLSNDFGPVDASKPFQPFGPTPMQGSALVVGSRELFQKQVTDANLLMNWMANPYPHKTTPTVVMDALVQGGWVDLFAEPVPLVGWNAAGFDLTVAAEKTGVNAPDLAPSEPYRTSSRHGFARLRLTGGFGQQEYAVELVTKIVAAAKPPTTPPTPPVTPPAAPVIPTAADVTLGYSAVQTIRFGAAVTDALDDGYGRFFHVTPFGQAEQSRANHGSAVVTLLPQITTPDGTRAEAALYLGISQLRPPQSLALLAEVVDGTANPLAVKPSDHVRWSYLQDNEWVGFARDAVDDQTDGLLESGVITLAVPADASADSTAMPSGLHWVRATVQSDSDAVCRLSMIAAQGLRATFADHGNDPAFASKVLAPGVISKLNPPDGAIKTIAQPFASFGGRGAESSRAFSTRASERLRHKDRAITLWDYERLILEAFPNIHRVRCLNHTRFGPDDSGHVVYRELAPGHVTVVTVPVQQQTDQRDPLRPYTSLGVLSQIEAFLTKRMPCFVKLHVRNPQFEQVAVDFRVHLRDGFDETYYVNKLREEITRFLSPWGFGDPDGPTFTGTFYKSVLIDLVEERPYVDYLTDFRLIHRYAGRDAAGTAVEITSPDADQVTGSRAISVLVSAPPAQHIIRVIHPAEADAAAEDCPCQVTTR